MNKLSIYTDGGCHGNPGPGAWAYIIETGSEKIKKAGFESGTTNNRMELAGAINGLKRIIDEKYKDYKVIIFTDSQYVKKGITEWIHSWEKKGWKTADKQPVKNQELWKELKMLSDKLNPEWKWTQGHAGNVLNEECDDLVQKTIKDNINR